jgi:Spore cortex protein YabQ (Spore_YabQ).
MNIAVNPLIINQVFEFIIMLAAGMTVMLFHDLFTEIKNRLKPGKSISFIQDILFWIFASILTSFFLYYCCFGQLSFHSFVAFALGVILWKIFFYDTIKAR